MKNIFKSITFALTIGVFLAGCDKAATEDIFDNDTSSSTDNSTSDNAFSGIFKSISEAADTSANLKAGPCGVVTVTPITAWPRTVTVDFGTGCNGKSGKIVAVLTGPFRTAGSVITITTEDYYDGLNKVEAGTCVITNLGASANGLKTFSFSVDSAKVTTPGGLVTWSTDREIQWAAGDTTLLDPSDDVYLITGQSSGISSKGVSFTASITTELKIAVACQWIESGVISLTPQGKAERIIDFGTTGCDNQAVVTIGGTEFPVTM